MAKELPYFKFETGAWDNGNIQICSRQDKGLFMDLCSLYWSRLGDCPLNLAIGKLCGGIAIGLDSLIENNIITISEGMIRIKFLDEQLEEVKNKSLKNSNNAKKRWSGNAIAVPNESEGNTIRREEIREEDTNKYADLQKFIVYDILSFFGFNEMNNFDKLSKISEAIKVIFFTGKHVHFLNSWVAFKTFRKYNPTSHNYKLTNFLGDSREKYIDGGWNEHAWIDLVIKIDANYKKDHDKLVNQILTTCKIK